MDNPRPRKRMAYAPKGTYNRGYKGLNGRLEKLLSQFGTSSLEMSIEDAVVEAVMEEEKKLHHHEAQRAATDVQ